MGTQLCLPISIQEVTHFIVYLKQQGYKSNTIWGHLSALAYVHKLLELLNNTNVFMAQKFVEFCKKTDAPSTVKTNP